ncbi:MAG: hypothetical protein EOO28_01970 [Comamonadaceae bacterium]|nr:MAG: hypothetical protein EOO28_01970 [Comamonadaceae bacterium]
MKLAVGLRKALASANRELDLEFMPHDLLEQLPPAVTAHFARLEKLTLPPLLTRSPPWLEYQSPPDVVVPTFMGKRFSALDPGLRHLAIEAGPHLTDVHVRQGTALDSIGSQAVDHFAISLSNPISAITRETGMQLIKAHFHDAKGRELYVTPYPERVFFETASHLKPNQYLRMNMLGKNPAGAVVACRHLLDQWIKDYELSVQPGHTTRLPDLLHQSMGSTESIKRHFTTHMDGKALSAAFDGQTAVHFCRPADASSFLAARALELAPGERRIYHLGIAAKTAAYAHVTGYILRREDFADGRPLYEVSHFDANATTLVQQYFTTDPRKLANLPLFPELHRSYPECDADFVYLQENPKNLGKTAGRALSLPDSSSLDQSQRQWLFHVMAFRNLALAPAVDWVRSSTGGERQQLLRKWMHSMEQGAPDWMLEFGEMLAGLHGEGVLSKGEVLDTLNNPESRQCIRSAFLARLPQSTPVAQAESIRSLGEMLGTLLNARTLQPGEAAAVLLGDDWRTRPHALEAVEAGLRESPQAAVEVIQRWHRRGLITLQQRNDYVGAFASIKAQP